MVKNISLIDKHRQYLTPTEKKIIIQMLNAGMQKGQVRNKVFFIEKTGPGTATVTKGEITKSIILGRREIVSGKYKIKYW